MQRKKTIKRKKTREREQIKKNRYLQEKIRSRIEGKNNFKNV